VVISSNAPLDCQRQIQRAARREGARFVFWLQDIYSAAIGEVLARRLPGAGHLVAVWYRWLEGRMLRRSDAVVAIAEAFCAPLAAWGVDPARISVIGNWAPLDEIPVLPRDNAWAEAHFAPGRLRFVYSGTLGYKHNPHWLLALAEALPQSDVEVFSEGAVAEALEQQAQAQRLANLTVRPWVAFADLPAMLAGSDVAVAFIEPGAGNYSVPSKILTYLAAGRPVLAAIPPANLAAQLIVENAAGCVVDCNDTAGFIAAAQRLAADPALRERQGGNGRAHALRAFAINHIADRFLAAIAGGREVET
jgi:glycosyltransferase involved in cell wall biosynthesis